MFFSGIVAVRVPHAVESSFVDEREKAKTVVQVQIHSGVSVSSYVPRASDEVCDLIVERKSRRKKPAREFVLGIDSNVQLPSCIEGVIGGRIDNIVWQRDRMRRRASQRLGDYLAVLVLRACSTFGIEDEVERTRLGELDVEQSIERHSLYGAPASPRLITCGLEAFLALLMRVVARMMLSSVIIVLLWKIEMAEATWKVPKLIRGKTGWRCVSLHDDLAYRGQQLRRTSRT